MIYIIDHNDSFTHNVVHQFSSFSKVECDNFDKIDQKKINKAKKVQSVMCSSMKRIEEKQRSRNCYGLNRNN